MKNHRNLLILSAVILLVISLFLVVRHGREDETASRGEFSSAESKSNPPKPYSASKRLRDEETPDSREADRQLQVEGVKTDVSLSQFPRKAYRHLPVPAGKPAGDFVGEAYIHVPSSGRRVATQPNQIGEYPTMETMTHETVGVRLDLDGVKSGTPVRVVIMDGGGFPAAQGVTQILNAEKGGVAFEFTTSPNIGYHRVLVQAQGHTSRILNFDASDGETWPPRDTASNQ
jgi:hypothetical protein